MPMGWGRSLAPRKKEPGSQAADNQQAKALQGRCGARSVR